MFYISGKSRVPAAGYWYYHNLLEKKFGKKTDEKSSRNRD
jgi:hypothetical protein